MRRRAIHLQILRSRSTVDQNGAVKSVQRARVTLPSQELKRVWSPLYLERLARTYWQFLERTSLKLLRVEYSKSERSIVLLSKRIKLLTFFAPDYELSGDTGIVRWRIKRGILAAKEGHSSDGYLEIAVKRDLQSTSATEQDANRVDVKVEVANFYPSIAKRFSMPVYKITQSAIHVLFTNAFLRSLVKRDLATSKVGALAQPED